jgi:hypothetical protein
MRHQSTEKLARNLEQLLSGPKVGAETRSAPTPAGAGTGAGGGGGGGTGGVGVERGMGVIALVRLYRNKKGRAVNKMLSPSPSLLTCSPSHASHRYVTHVFSSQYVTSILSSSHHITSHLIASHLLPSFFCPNYCSS